MAFFSRNVAKVLGTGAWTTIKRIYETFAMGWQAHHGLASPPASTVDGLASPPSVEPVFELGGV